jgi:hypothetical protein
MQKNLIITLVFEKKEFFYRKLAKIAEVDVMITIFCGFRQFSAKKWRFSQNQCYHQVFS